jgi:hypothetical protein
MPRDEVPKEEEPTTIQISRKVHTQLANLKLRWNTSFNDTITRLLNNQTDVFFSMLLIDNELPQTHTAVFQLGEDKNSLYFFDGKDSAPITIEETQKKLKEAMPLLALTQDEVVRLQSVWAKHADNTVKENMDLWSHMAQFLEETRRTKKNTTKPSEK